MIFDVEIFDVMGRMVMTVAVETLRATSLQSDIGQSHIEINISHLPAGVYFIKITTDKGTVTKKVMKN